MVWVFQAVNFLDIMIEDGRGYLVYLNYTLLNFPKIIKIPNELKEKIDIAKNNVQISHDAKKACKNSDCIITDTWFSMGKKPTEKLIKAFKPYQVNKKIMSVAKKNATFMHCLPATRGNEVTEDVIDNLNCSLVWSEAENRLHIQKAILEWCLKKSDNNIINIFFY